MRTVWLRWICAVAAVVVTPIMGTPARAAGSGIIAVSSPANLILAGSSVPSGYSARPAESHAITVSSMRPLLGRHLTGTFVKHGWATGFHGWLDPDDPTGDMFVTYDFYGFKTVPGAQASTRALLQLTLGVQTPIVDKRLPNDTSVFIDETGTYGPDSNPFTAVEVVFRAQNVVADITGYYAGDSASDVDAATSATIGVTSQIASWLFAQALP